MLDKHYFIELGQPTERQLGRLPPWALIWIGWLKNQALEWHAASEGRSVDFNRLRPWEPSPENLLTLPIWAQEWINTLKFEVIWWRDIVGKPESETKGKRCRKSLF